MNEPINTGFLDKTKRPIYVGDIVQHRLGKFGKSSGPQNLRVIQFGKAYHLVKTSQTDVKYGGTALTEATSQKLVVVESDYIRG